MFQISISSLQYTLQTKRQWGSALSTEPELVQGQAEGCAWRRQTRKATSKPTTHKLNTRGGQLAPAGQDGTLLFSLKNFARVKIAASLRLWLWPATAYEAATFS